MSKLNKDKYLDDTFIKNKIYNKEKIIALELVFDNV